MSTLWLDWTGFIKPLTPVYQYDQCTCCCHARSMFSNEEETLVASVSVKEYVTPCFTLNCKNSWCKLLILSDIHFRILLMSLICIVLSF